jgi:hypothetical protein
LLRKATPPLLIPVPIPELIMPIKTSIKAGGLVMTGADGR